MKREPRWVKVFLAALERTGNVRLAAERAGIDFSTAYQRRKRHGDFAEAWERALGALRADPSTIGSAANGPPPRSGEELVARQSFEGAQLVRVGEGRWSAARAERFLASLADCANVRRAAEAAGVSTQAVYKRRLKDPAFREAWEAALETGKARLELMLVEAAQRRFDPDALPMPGGEAPLVSVGEAINLLKLHRDPVRAAGQRGGPEPRVASDAEVEASLIKRLKVFAKRVWRDKLAEGWSIYEGELIPPGWVKGEEARCAECGKALTPCAISA